jgi:hypothetical protein
MATDETCGVFSRLDGALDPERVHRFVVGEDSQPSAMSPEQAEQELGDPFATLVLLQGKFPQTAAECLAAIDEATAEGDPLKDQMSFLVGEGSQIAVEENTTTLGRGLRFIITRGATANGPPDGPDILLSVFHPDQKDIELMAWDRRAGGFNYYRTVGDDPAWVFAGNARHALSDPTQGKGPFESHTSGAFLMKELKLPWINWHSPNANIFATAFADDDDRCEHPWFTDKEPGGALTCELAVAKPGMERWARARFQALTENGGAIRDPGRIMEQLLSTPTVNLFSSRTESRAAAGSSDAFDLPGTFFVDADGFAAVGLDGPPPFAVAGNIYASSLRTFEAKLTDGEGFVRDGDTHFAFVVPERAFEDQVVLVEAMRSGLVSRRLAACLLMTDFPNPVFSARRARLLAHVPGSAAVSDGQSSFSQEMADAILAAAEGSPEESPEREFAERWNVGEDFDSTFNGLLADYYAAVTERLGDQAGFDAYFQLAETRRVQVRKMPIFENPLLFARTNVPTAPRSMQGDGSVI